MCSITDHHQWGKDRRERRKERKKKRKERLQYSLSLCETLLVHTLQVCHLDPCTDLLTLPSARGPLLSQTHPSFCQLITFKPLLCLWLLEKPLKFPLLLTSGSSQVSFLALMPMFFFSLVSALQHELRVTWPYPEISQLGLCVCTSL